MDTVIAVYEQGVLRLLDQIALAEHTRVRVQIIEEITAAGVDHPLLALANLGECQEDDVSVRAEEILAAEAHPDTGWSVSDADPR